MWEVFSLGQMPYPGLSPVEVVEFLDEGSRLSKPSNTACSEEMLAMVDSDLSDILQPLVYECETKLNYN